MPADVIDNVDNLHSHILSKVGLRWWVLVLVTALPDSQTDLNASIAR